LFCCFILTMSESPLMIIFWFAVYLLEVELR
jgi:hypothetical protein